MKLRLVRLNPLLLDPGALVLMGARQLDNGVISQFPVRLEYWKPLEGAPVDGEFGSWEPVEFENEFQSNEDSDAREVRPEVQIPIYSKSARNKRGSGKSGSGQS